MSDGLGEQVPFADPAFAEAPGEVRMSKQRFDRARARRFKQGWSRYVPQLTLWDATSRLIATEARLRRRFAPGFLLDDEVAGTVEARQGKTPVVYINPDELASVIKAQAGLTRARGPRDDAAELLRELEAGLTRSPQPGVGGSHPAGCFARHHEKLLNLVGRII